MSEKLRELTTVFQALRFAAAKHRDQRRKGRTAPPYVNHLIEVADVLARVGAIDDNDTLVAAILHDTIEDTQTTPAEIEEPFGPSVRRVVEEVTDDKRLPKAERKRLQIVQAPQKSHRAKLVKLADKICNVRDIAFSPPADWPASRRAEYFDWAEHVVAGLRGTNDALERCFDETLRDARAALEREQGTGNRDQ